MGLNGEIPCIGNTRSNRCTGVERRVLRIFNIGGISCENCHSLAAGEEREVIEFDWIRMKLGGRYRNAEWRGASQVKSHGNFVFGA